MNEAKDKIGHIGVLMGGYSSERDISLKSGNAVYQALKGIGCQVTALDIKTVQETEIIELLTKHKIEVAFIALHGEFGEDGGIQDILEKHHIPYTGSGPQASRLTMDKTLTQEMIKKSGMVVPPYHVITKGQAFDADQVFEQTQADAVVVKPACEGSSMGITIATQKDKLSQAVKKAFEFDSKVLIDKYIKGKEVTVGILGEKALALVEIRPKGPFFDFTSKYQKGMSDYIVPAEVPEAVSTQVQHLGLKSFQLLGCRDYARVDFILDEQNTPHFLEINTIPGFTATSLLPMAAKKEGYSFGELCLCIAQLASTRKSTEFV